MKQVFIGMVLAAVLASVSVARAELVYVVEITDLQKAVSHDIKTAAELKELKKSIEDEARVFPKALEQVKKEWEAAEKPAPAAPGEKPAPGAKPDKPVPPTPFPSGMLAPRKCQEKGSFTDRDKAQKKMDQLETAAADVIAKEAKKNQGKQPTEAEKSRQAHAAERAAAAAKAVTALQTKIDELLKNPAGAGGAAAAPAPAAAAAPVAAPQ